MWVIGLIVCVGLMLGGHAVVNRGEGSHAGHHAAATAPAAPPAAPGTEASPTTYGGAACAGAPAEPVAATGAGCTSAPEPQRDHHR